jgi:hypothetical protein
LVSAPSKTANTVQSLLGISIPTKTPPTQTTNRTLFKLLAVHSRKLQHNHFTSLYLSLLRSRSCGASQRCESTLADASSLCEQIVRNNRHCDNQIGLTNWRRQ